MTQLEFWGCSLITFGPAVAMFALTVAHDPIKVILLITSSFFWLLSLITAAICWSVINRFSDYLIIGATLAVLSQEVFRYLFHRAAKRAQRYLTKLLCTDIDSSKASTRSSEIQLGQPEPTEFQATIPFSYVAGLGFGLINAAFLLMNALSDYSGPGTVGIKGDSNYFLLVSSLTALAFILLNVSWSVLMTESIEKSDRRLAAFVLVTHLVATCVTFMNKFQLQFVSVTIIYGLTILCGLGAFQVSDLSPSRLVSIRRTRTNL